MDNLFEQATRLKVRFEYRGQISVEDLWDLPKTALNAIYGDLKAKQRETAESLLTTKTVSSQLLDLKIELVKYVFDTKEQELAGRKAAEEKRLKKQKLMEVLAQKQDAALLNMSEADLRKMIEEM